MLEVSSYRGRVYIWHPTMYPIANEQWAANVTDVRFDSDGTGALCVEKGPRDMVREYVEAVQADRRPRLRLVCTEEDSESPQFLSAFITVDLEPYLADPDSLICADLPFKWFELLLKRSLA